ncbi:MAG: GNAT family N-acetyltransferase [Chloroflexota bacterium]|nr:GNAT family N-acetyltransferase [Chloroflexota bacterium]
MHRRGTGHLRRVRGGRLTDSAAAYAVERTPDAAAFEARALPFLGEREAENNLVIGLARNLRNSPRSYGRDAWFMVVVRDGAVVGAALRTPPRYLILSGIDDERAIDALARDLAVHDAQLPGCMGELQVAQRFVETWAWLTGARYAVTRRERIHRLARVIWPRMPSGHARRAAASDRELLTAWIDAFWKESLGESDGGEATLAVNRWLNEPERTMYLWDDGRPVAMCGVSGPTPNGIRIGPVYTPPPLRRRGYASACVAVASQEQIDAGRRFCFLFTDAANATANHIYREVGYEPVCDAIEYRIVPPSRGTLRATIGRA